MKEELVNVNEEITAEFVKAEYQLNILKDHTENQRMCKIILEHDLNEVESKASKLEEVIEHRDTEIRILKEEIEPCYAASVASCSDAHNKVHPETSFDPKQDTKHLDHNQATTSSRTPITCD